MREFPLLYDFITKTIELKYLKLIINLRFKSSIMSEFPFSVSLDLY